MANGTLRPLENGASKPSVQKALKIKALGKMKLIENARSPHIKADKIAHYVGLNSVDAKSADTSPSVGSTPGCDFAGKNVTVKSAVREIFRWVIEYVVACSETILKRMTTCIRRKCSGSRGSGLQDPFDNVLTNATTVGLGMSTVGLALHHKLELPLPDPQAPTSERNALCFGLWRKNCYRYPRYTDAAPVSRTLRAALFHPSTYTRMKKSCKRVCHVILGG